MEKLRKLLIEILATLKDIQTALKAVIAFVAGVIGVVSLYLTLSKDGLSGEDISAILNAIVVVIGTTFGVWILPNKAKR